VQLNIIEKIYKKCMLTNQEIADIISAIVTLWSKGAITKDRVVELISMAKSMLQEIPACESGNKLNSIAEKLLTEDNPQLKQKKSLLQYIRSYAQESHKERQARAHQAWIN